MKLWLGATQLLVSIKDPKIIKYLLSKATDKMPSTGKAFDLAFGRSSLFVSSFSEVLHFLFLFYRYAPSFIFFFFTVALVRL